jgi:hypothetical protein
MKLTLRRTFTTILFLGLFIMTMRPIADPDFWWHLRTGQFISDTHDIPRTDPFSFTKAGETWIAHEWLADLGIFKIFQLGGYGALIFIFSLIITVAFLTAYLRCTVESRPYVAGFILLLGAISTAPTWGVRPQMISLFFTSLFLFLLDRYWHDRNYKLLIPIPFITLLWVNLHAGYFLGLAILGIFIVGGVIEILLAETSRGEEPRDIPALKSIFLLCGCLVACMLAALGNPNGFHILIYPFQTLFSPSMQKLIQEWFSPNFHQMMWQPLAWFILALIGIGMVSKKQIKPTYIILTLVFGYAALRSMRNIPIFIVTAIPVLSDQICFMVNIPSETRFPNRLVRLTTPFILICMAVIASLHFIQVVQEQSSTEAEIYPKAAVDWLLKNKPARNLFNTYDWGGYLIWRTYPTYRVFIDGRADVYGDKFIFDFVNIYHAEAGWEDTLNQQGVHTILVESNSPLATIIRRQPEWHIAFEDITSVIFIR